MVWKLPLLKKQLVEVDNFKSHQTFTTGVTPGSTLGPLLFLIYMSKLFKFIRYADGTTLFSTLDYSLSLDVSTSCELINRELSRVGEWLIINCLSINISKTKYMPFHYRQKDVSHVKLGMVIDKHILWKYHIEMLSNKISKYCGVFSRLKNYLPLFSLRTMYFIMVHSHFYYGLLAWGSIIIVQ